MLNSNRRSGCYAFGLAAVALIASFAKAGWTHLNLEDNRWSGIRNYRERLWRNSFMSGVEFIFRVAIAVSVVLLQKQIAMLAYIDNIQYASNWTFQDEGLSASFADDFSEWLATTSIYGTVLFVLISLWLIIAGWYNSRHKLLLWLF